MKRSELEELHFITHMGNVPSILKRGILSHVRAASRQHTSIALQPVQDKRAAKVIPGGRPLHEYANLYICGRNPMLFKRLDQHLEVCVLAISTDVLDIEGAVVSDQNAASDYVRFAPAPKGLSIVDAELTFAESWTDPDQIQKWRKSSRKCAEVLVPDVVEPDMIMHAYVSCKQAKAAFDALHCGLEANVNEALFFRVGG
jgi:hypothetical protein